MTNQTATRTTPPKRSTTAKQAAYRFFYANAGWGYDPAKESSTQGRARGARLLAKAERDATALGYSFLWEEDYDGYPDTLGDHAAWCDDEQNGLPHEHEVFVCIMSKPDGEACQVLGAIIEPSREYRRVVEAELALEELGQ